MNIRCKFIAYTSVANPLQCFRCKSVAMLPLQIHCIEIIGCKSVALLHKRLDEMIHFIKLDIANHAVLFVLEIWLIYVRCGFVGQQIHNERILAISPVQIGLMRKHDGWGRDGDSDGECQ